MKLSESGLRKVGLSDFLYHGIKREVYLFPLVKNVFDVIKIAQKPTWVKQQLCDLGVLERKMGDAAF